MSSYPKAQLCKLCKYAFSSHWVAKESVQLKATDQEEVVSEQGNAENSDDDASFGDDFYEAPDWITVTTDDATPQPSETYLSPPHHNLAQLEISASQGCYLCLILFDKVRDEIKGLPTEKKAIIGRLRSFIIARPSNDDSFGGEVVQLEISYFVDGLIESDAFALTVGITLYKLLPDEVVTEETFQPPLCHEANEDPLMRSIGRVTQWILACANTHHSCKHEAQSRHNSSASSQLPTRLLRLVRNAGSARLSLCEKESCNSPHTKYATLSHCWGTSQPVKLLSKNYQEFKQSVEISSLPRTFQDAITLSFALDIEYLWIDSLCIIQDSPDDWLREASLMCSVYANSWLNFAATSSRDGTGGLFHKSALVKNCAIDAMWTGLSAGLYLCVDETAWERRVENAPLNQRSWVLQERMLSPRTLHCAYDQMWWSCRDAPNCCETFPTGAMIPPWTTTPSLNCLHELGSQDLVSWNEEWLNVVRAYTKTRLTYGSDKLIAFAGIAQEAQRCRALPSADYLAGLWRDGLPADLLWRMVGVGTRDTTTYRAPSWSWASVDGEVYFHSSEQRERARENLVARILGSDISANHGWFGPVSDGWLKISGPVLSITLSGLDKSATGEPSFQKLCLGGEKFTGGDGFVEILDHEELYKDWATTGRQLHYACLKATSLPRGDEIGFESEGLILESVSEKDDSYRRIGWLRVFHETQWVTACQTYSRMYTLL